MDSNSLPINPTSEGPVTRSGWIARNLTTLVIVVVSLVVLGYVLRGVEDPVEWVLKVAKMALGLALVIFIHELGHFLAAKWCDVHVETFSIGFIGSLFGVCSYKWGETTYKIGWLPLGGYVKMVGEGDESDEGADDPRSYKNKKVWQRMIIISAGVVMNLFLAWVCYMVVYMTHGIDQNPGVIGAVVPGGPAWKKGLRPGDAIRRIGDQQDPYYDQLKREVMRAGRSELPLAYDSFVDGRPVRHETTITPARSDEILAPMLMIESAHIPVLSKKIPKIKGPFLPDTPASRAEPPFEFDDRIVGATNPDNLSEITPLRPDPRRPGEDLGDYFDFRRREQRLAGKPMTVRVRRAADRSEVDVRVEAAFARTIGLRMRMGQIVAIRDGSAAAEAGTHVQEGKTKGDVIQAVAVTGADGKIVRFTDDPKEDDKPLDPMKLPVQLAQWAAAKPKDYTVRVTVWRPDGHQDAKKTLEITWDPTWEYYDISNLGTLDTPLTLAGLGLAYQVQPTIAGIEPGSPAAGSGLQEGDVIDAVEFRVMQRSGKVESEPSKVKENQWASFAAVLHERESIQQVVLTVKNKDAKITLVPREDKSWPLVDRGMVFESDIRTEQPRGFIHAAGLSAGRVLVTAATIYENLAGLMSGRISVLGISGPATIAKHSFDLAGRDTFQLILFIAMINVNLAVVNFLPIPVLDGGHMLFLFYELLRGKPPSDRWRFILTIMGLVVVLGLMVLGLALDFSRLALEPLKQMLGM